jgi:hypothetical protein
MPAPTDVLDDPTACQLLEAWARHPWSESAAWAVMDAAEEAGFDPRQLAGLRAAVPQQMATWDTIRHQGRRAVRRSMNAFRQWLRMTFGDFEAATTEPPF